MLESVGISENDATQILEAFRRVHSLHDLDVPLPTKYKSMKKTVMNISKDRLAKVKKEFIRYPRELFIDPVVMKDFTFVHYDIVEAVASMLVDPRIVGTLKQFTLNFNINK